MQNGSSLVHNICNQKWIAARTWIRFKWKWHRNQHQISWFNGWTCYARCMCQCVLLFRAELWACPIPKWHFMQFNVDTRSDKLTAISPNSILSHVENFNEFHGEKKKIGAIQKTMPPNTNKWNGIDVQDHARLQWSIEFQPFANVTL